jgi:hypothetical protein
VAAQSHRAAMSIEVGQVYASTHKGDIASGQRQRRHVERVDATFVWLRTKDERYEQYAPLSQVRWQRTATGQRIPGHRLVEGPRCCGSVASDV